MDFSKCDTVADIFVQIDVYGCGDYQNHREDSHYSGTEILAAIQRAYELGQQARNLPCYTVGDVPPERRKNPRGDVARNASGLPVGSWDKALYGVRCENAKAIADAALNGGEPQRTPPRLYAGFPACYLAPVPETKEID